MLSLVRHSKTIKGLEIDNSHLCYWDNLLLFKVICCLHIHFYLRFALSTVQWCSVYSIVAPYPTNCIYLLFTVVVESMWCTFVSDIQFHYLA